jgi:hypothetical protein
MSNVILEALAKPFPREAIKTRSGGGGKQLQYVEAHTVIRRLNEATGGKWSLSVLRLEMMGDVFTAHVSLTIPELGSREHIGVQRMQQNAGEDLAKGAISDALKKAATLFGVGLELYGRDYEGDTEAPIGFSPQTIPGVRSGFDQAKKPEVAQQTRTAPARQGSGPKDLSGENCSECGVALSNAVLKFSCDKYGNPLCFDHQQGRQSNPNSRQSHVPVRDTPIPPPMPEQDYNEVDLSDPFAEG